MTKKMVRRNRRSRARCHSAVPRQTERSRPFPTVP